MGYIQEHNRSFFGSAKSIIGEHNLLRPTPGALPRLLGLPAILEVAFVIFIAAPTHLVKGRCCNFYLRLE